MDLVWKLKVSFFVFEGLSSSDHGYWSSSNINVVQVNKHTGEAFALGAGSASGMSRQA